MDDIKFGILEPCDFEEAVKFLRRDYLQVETVTSGVGLSPPVDESALVDEAAKQFILSMLAQEFTITAKSKDSEKIIGLSISTSMEEDIKNASQFEDLCAANEGFHKVAVVYETVDGDRDLYKEFNITSILICQMLSVDPSFRKRGIATELVRRGIVLGKSKGFQLIRTFASSPISQKIFNNLEFQLLKEVKFHDIIFNGEPAVKGTGPTDTMQLRVKSLM